VKIAGFSNLPARIAADASNLYARNLVNLAGLFLNKDKAFAPDFEDEILKGAVTTRGGEIVHPNLKGA
jgi:NAD(P) transhydrogenase subunit alpha